MKKFFLFAAAVIAAMTVNAKVLDLSVVGTTIDEWTPGAGATLNEGESDVEKAKYVYDIKGGEANITYITEEEGIEFQTKNSSDKKKAFSIYPGKCFEYGGKNGILVIRETDADDVIKIKVAAKGSTPANFKDEADAYPKNAEAVTEDLVLPAKDKDAEGADEQGYIWKVLEFKSLGGDVEIKEFNGGYRIAAIAINEELPENITNTQATVKAEKFFRNGQLVIRKNGVEYNALGAQL